MRVLGIVLIIVGALLGGTGGYASATYVRSGDWVLGPAAVVNPGVEHVVVSQYGLLSYDTDIRVTATSDSDLSLGTANPIDTDDYTATITHATITSLSWRTITTTSIAADLKDPAAAPSDVDFWLSRVSGTSPELVIAPGAKVPPQVILVTTTGGPITLRVDYHVAGIRVIVFGVIGVGAALALIGLVLFLLGIRRARRKKSRVTPVAPPVAPPSYQPVPPPWMQGPVSRWVAGLVAVTLVVTSAGCSVPTMPRVPAIPSVPAIPRMPKQTSVPSRADITKVPLTSDQSTAVANDLAHRVFVARLDGYGPTFSPDKWSQAFTDLSLQTYIFDTAFAKASGEKRSAPSCSIEIETVFGSVAAAYPMTATALTKWTCGDASSVRVLAVLTRAHSYSPWFIASESQLEDGTSLEPGKGAPANAEQQAGSAAATDLLTYLNKGTSVTVTPPADLGAFHAVYTVPTAGAVHTMSATIVSGADKQGSFRFAKTANGILVSASYVVTCTSSARPGYELWWDAPLDQVLNQPGHRSVLTRKFGLFATLLLEGNTVAMVGFDVAPIL